MKVVMATNNQNKLREAREILSPLGIEVLSQQEAGANVEPDENGETFADNALIKAKAVYDIVKMPVFADDSGLCVDALGGAPGVHSARYAPKGEECRKLLREMQNVPDESRRAYFQCTVAYIDENGSGPRSASCVGKIFTTAGHLPKCHPRRKMRSATAVRHCGCCMRSIRKGTESNMLTSKQRAYLRGIAQSYETIFQIGKGGINDNLIMQVNDALRKRELIKLRVLDNSGYTSREAADAIAEKVSADVVQVIGSRFVLFKRNPQDPVIDLKAAK